MQLRFEGNETNWFHDEPVIKSFAKKHNDEIRRLARSGDRRSALADKCTACPLTSSILECCLLGDVGGKNVLLERLSMTFTANGKNRTFGV